ncbi:MAG TPA: tRNA (adenosine(37)-N6)-threonylcarbamoyltransferase complex transferase subunit TsaD [Burkholderiaceae bacterium]|nr:tRNA (adenosine(37)-N6)-threonylcarbamoyltransferase complex transferase subunit TsaD [Burkholderiaceae bacterium]HQR71624.1 tRNA (adenosine(37)-N6)-threonylcarbamoyltransferase complex transferase subunit TsaD [Burkholderiaceae bacterium]
MLILGIETSCDETGVALLDSEAGLLAQALHSQVQMHQEYGGVVPELASRDHIRRVLPLLESVLAEARRGAADIDAIAVTSGPGLAGALLVGSSIAHALGYALARPVVGVHHLEGHLLSPLLAEPAPEFPFVALLVSGGHTQLMRVDGWGRYALLGETLDDAAGEAFDKTAQLLGLDYPGGPAVSRLAEFGVPGVLRLPRPMLANADLDFSFSGLKTAVLTAVRKQSNLCEQGRADIARAFVDAIVDVLATKSRRALEASELTRLVVAGGVGANTQLRERLRADARRHGTEVHFPPVNLCTDNGAMIALAGVAAMRRVDAAKLGRQLGFAVQPRWTLAEATG